MFQHLDVHFQLSLLREFDKKLDVNMFIRHLPEDIWENCTCCPNINSSWKSTCYKWNICYDVSSIIILGREYRRCDVSGKYQHDYQQLHYNLVPSDSRRYELVNITAIGESNIQLFMTTKLIKILLAQHSDGLGPEQLSRFHDWRLQSAKFSVGFYPSDYGISLRREHIQVN